MISTYSLSMNSSHYARMDEQECKKIHMATLEILERTGADVHDKTAKNILIKGGMEGESTVMNSLIRLSGWLENSEDLIRDLDRALI